MGVCDLFALLQTLFYWLSSPPRQPQMIQAKILKADLNTAAVLCKFYGAYGRLETVTQRWDSACCLSLGITEVSVS